MTDYFPQSEIQNLKMAALKRHGDALARELAEIDRLVCPKCPDSIMDEERLLGDDIVVMVKRTCAKCGYEEEGVSS